MFVSSDSRSQRQNDPNHPGCEVNALLARGMNKAKLVLFSGCSAGGRGRQVSVMNSNRSGCKKE